MMLKALSRIRVSPQLLSRSIATPAKEIEVFVNGKPIKAEPWMTIYQACQLARVRIPKFCYHDALRISGNCRMCLVEVEGNPKPVPACTMHIAPGMRINTESEKTRIARGGVLEFLLANHPLDCPICDQGGECDLQETYMAHGFQAGRYNEYKRGVEYKYIGPIVQCSMTRCIHCTRCVRFSKQISGDYSMGETGRSKYKEIGTYKDALVTNELSGNMADLCPVGALLHMPQRFRFRPWELLRYHSVDLMDALGTPIEIHTRGPEVMRILPRVFPDVNEEWVSDKGRQAFDGLKYQRLNTILKRRPDGKLQELTWDEGFQAAIKAFKSVKPEEIQGRIGPFADVEAVVALRDLLHRLGCERLVYSSDNNELQHDFRAQYQFGSTIRGVSFCDALLMVGFNLRTTSPVLNARVRRGVTERGLKVGVIGPGEDLLYKYTHLGNSTKTLDEIANKKHPFSKVLERAQLPLVMVSSDILRRKDGKEIAKALHKLCIEHKVIKPEIHWNGYSVMLKTAAEGGAHDIGLASNMTEEEKKKPVKLVYLLGVDDNLADIPGDAFVIYQGFHGDAGAARADLILPSTAFIEKKSTYVNTEGRAQITRKTVIPTGMAKDDWEIIRALSEEMGCTLPYDNLEEVRGRIAELAPHIVRLDHLEPMGFADLITNYGAKGANDLKPGILADSVDVTL